MLAPSIPRDQKIFNRAPTNELWEWAHHADDYQLGLIRIAARKRSRPDAVRLQRYCDERLDGPRALAPNQIEVSKPQPWYRRRVVQIGVVVLGAIGMGVGHGAGEQIWQTIWPTVTRMIGL